MKILIVDDEPVMRELLMNFLQWEGERMQVTYEVETAVNGQHALQVLREWRADAVVSDIDMPCLDGIGLLSQIRAEWPLLPVVLMSGRVVFSSSEELVLERHGVQPLLKPFSLEQLLARVMELSLQRGAA